MKIKTLIVLLTLAFSTQVFAVTKSPIKQFAQPLPDKALVYMIRENHFIASARTMFIYSDETFLAALDNNTYSYAYIEPGNHLIWANWTSVQKNMEFVAGQTYYLNIFTQVGVLSSEQGAGLINATISNFASATDKEKKTADKHIRNRFGRAVKKMQKQDYAIKPMQQLPTIQSQPRPGSVKLPLGSSIKVMLLENITSGYNNAGDTVKAQVAEDVYVDGKLVVAKAAPIIAVVNHKSKGKMGGTGGDLDVVVTAATAVDGGVVAIGGQISNMSADRTDEALKRQLLFGLAGLLSVGKRQTYLFSQQIFTVPTKSDSWIIPAPKNLVSAPAALPTPTTAQNVYAGKIEKPIKFQPQKKTKMADVKITLPAQFQWDTLSLVTAGGTSLPAPLAAKEKIVGKTEQVFIFDSWNIVRYLPLGLNQSEYSLQFNGQSGGNTFPVEAKVHVDIIAK